MPRSVFCRHSVIDAERITLLVGLPDELPPLVDDPVALVREFAGRMPAARPSVLLDLEAGRISEVDVINGAVPREGEKVGVDAPVNRTLTALVRTLERRT